MTDITMAWVDFETTGLDAQIDVPLELGIILTDSWGSEVASEKWLIWENNFVYNYGVHRGKTNEFVNPMHDASGLWDEVIGKGSSRQWVGTQVAEFLYKWNVEKGSLPMCGNSIGSLDRPFMITHFPDVNGILHYRNIDVSSVKEICKRVNPDLYEKLKPIIGTKADATHRVLEDCRASIKEYQTYLDEFLIVGD